MDLTLPQALYGAFMLFTSFAVLNAHLNKWLQSAVFFLMGLVCITVGTLHGLSPWWGLLLLSALALIVVMLVVRIRASRRTSLVNENVENAPEIAARMLTQMNQNVAERKTRR